MMPPTSDVIVIGGGVNGASIAYHLARRGASVKLLEKDNIASGPTGRSCGIIRQHYSHPVTARMSLQALHVFQNFDEIVGGDCDFHQCGFLVAAGEGQIDTLRDNVAMQQAVGIDTRLVSVEELRDLAPGVATDGIAGAAYEPQSGYADPYSTSAAYVQRAEELGAEILVGTAVESLLVESGRVVGVATDGGRFSAGSVVLATGPWSPLLTRACGVELPITPMRVQVCLFERAAGLRHDKVFVDTPRGVYTRPEGEDLMLVGSVQTDEAKAGVEHPDHYQRTADFDAVSRYSEQLIGRFPAMDEGNFVNGYASLYDVTPDWQPILDEVPGVDNLFCAAGSSGHGFKLAPVVGEMVAELVLRGALDSDEVSLFGCERFLSGDLMDGSYAHKILG